jgi:sensor domain CHASE-containing protein
VRALEWLLRYNILLRVALLALLFIGIPVLGTVSAWQQEKEYERTHKGDST